MDFLSSVINWIIDNHVIILLIIAFFAIIGFVGFAVTTIKELILYGWDTITRRRSRYMQFGCMGDSVDYQYYNRKLHRECRKLIRKLPKEYIVKENICLESNNKYIFLNYVIISPYGVFIVAVHNAMGIVRGNPDYTKLKHITDGKAIFVLNNPTITMEKNTQILADAILVPNTPEYIHSFIAFSDLCRLAMPYKENMVNFRDLNNTIKSFVAPRFSDSQISAIIEELNKSNLKNFKKRKIARLTTNFSTDFSA